MNDGGQQGESQGAAGAGRQRDNRDLEQRIIAVIRGLRPESQWAIQQFMNLLEVDGVKGYAALEKPARSTDPVDVHFLGNLVIDTRDRYTRPARGR